MPMHALSPLLRRSRLAPLALACSLLVPGPAWSQAAPAPAPAAAAAARAPAGGDMVSSRSSVPAAALGAEPWLALEARRGQLIAARNAQEAVEPASLTQRMPAYVVFEALES